jgi:hypothetical protein
MGSMEEAGCGLAGLVGMDLGIGQPGVIIHRGVDEAVADQLVAIAAALTA